MGDAVAKQRKDAVQPEGDRPDATAEQQRIGGVERDGDGVGGGIGAGEVKSERQAVGAGRCRQGHRYIAAARIDQHDTSVVRGQRGARAADRRHVAAGHALDRLHKLRADGLARRDPGRRQNGYDLLLDGIRPVAVNNGRRRDTGYPNLEEAVRVRPHGCRCWQDRGGGRVVDAIHDAPLVLLHRGCGDLSEQPFQLRETRPLRCCQSQLVSDRRCWTDSERRCGWAVISGLG